MRSTLAPHTESADLHSPSASPQPTVVVLGGHTLGGFLAGVPAYRALARSCAERGERLVLAVPPALVPLGRWVPGIEHVVSSSRLRALRGLHRPRLAINARGVDPKSYAAVLALEPERLLAFRHASVPLSASGPTYWESEPEVARWCRLLLQIGVVANPDELELQILGVSPVASGYAVLHPASSAPRANWPLERHILLANTLADQGRRVVITGNRRDHRHATQIVEATGRPLVCSWAGGLRVSELATLVRHAELVVCESSEMSALAAAADTPSVTVTSHTEVYGRILRPMRTIHTSLRLDAMPQELCDTGELTRPRHAIDVDHVLRAAGLVLSSASLRPSAAVAPHRTLVA